MVSLRISAGSAKGRRIGLTRAVARGSEGDALRPTSAKVREALFDILRNDIRGASLLDLYAGTGSIGVEALSRGAAAAVFVESNRLRVRMIQQLLSEFGLTERSRVVHATAGDFVEREAQRRNSYDLVFVDPPYSSQEYLKVLPLIGEGALVRDGGAVIVEHFFKTKLPDKVGRLSLVKCYGYGDTVLSLYRLEKP